MKTEELVIITLAVIIFIAMFIIMDPSITGYVIYSPGDYDYESSLIEYDNGYRLIKQDLEITDLNPENYETAFLQAGDKYYIDREYNLTSIPDDLQNLLWIKTANDNKNTQDLGFGFGVNSPVKVYISYDKRQNITSWLSSWTYYGEGITTQDQLSNPYKIYYKNFEPGNINLGDNCESNCENNERSMYLVLIDTVYPESASLISEFVEPEDLASFDLLEKEEELNDQLISYEYSTDDTNWNIIEDFNLSYVNSTKIRFRITLQSDGTNTPIFKNLTINYIKEICTEGWTCTDWDECINETQTRICTDQNNCGTEDSKPEEEQDCPPCVEDWTCSEWSECINEIQTRECTDSNECGTFDSKPEEEQDCIIEETPGSLNPSSQPPSITRYESSAAASAPTVSETVSMPAITETKTVSVPVELKTIPEQEIQEVTKPNKLKIIGNSIAVSYLAFICLLIYRRRHLTE